QFQLQNNCQNDLHRRARLPDQFVDRRRRWAQGLLDSATETVGAFLQAGRCRTTARRLRKTVPEDGAEYRKDILRGFREGRAVADQAVRAPGARIERRTWHGED